MGILNRTRKLEQRHFIGMNRSRQLIEDTKALELNEELIVDSHNVAFDDDRQVPYRVLMQEGLPAVLRNHVQIYTGGSRRAERDAWWLLVKRVAIFSTAARTAAQGSNQTLSFVRKAGMWILGAGIVTFFGCLLIVGMSLKSQADAESAIPAATPVAAESSQEVLDGNATSENAESAPGENGAPGAQGAPGSVPTRTVIVVTQEPRQASDGAAGAPSAPVLTPASGEQREPRP